MLYEESLIALNYISTLGLLYRGIPRRLKYNYYFICRRI